MNKLKEILNDLFWGFMIGLVIFIMVEIGVDIYKNITISNKIKDTDICIYIDNELYCRLDYDIIINQPNSI